MARPSKFSSDIADAICEEIAQGKSLRSICERDDTPAMSTVFKWLNENEAFSEQYARAREAQADALFDDVLAIADQYDSAQDKMDVDHIQRAKLRIDARKWMAGKLRPKKYGEKLELSGDADSPIHNVHRVELVALKPADDSSAD